MKLWRARGKKTEYVDLKLEGKTLTTVAAEHWGTPTTKKKSFKTPALAKAGLETAIAEQRELGFRELGEIDPPAFEVPRDAGLEAEIRKHRDDPAPYLVYADWLQGKGSKFGEMIVFANRKKQKEAAAIAAKVCALPPKMGTATWRNGLWNTLHLQNDLEWMEGFDILRFVKAVFSSPLCAALEELKIGILQWDNSEQNVVLAEAGKHAWAKDLLRLRLGDVGDADVDMDHHSVGDVGKVITKSFPSLESLFLHSGGDYGSNSEFGFGGLDLPKLKELTIETCAMSRKRMKSLSTAKLPALERLVLWFGERERGANATLADVMPVWDGKLFPRLRHLGLCNTELVLDFIRLLPEGKLAKQLVSLDLSKGTLGDDGITELAEVAAKFPALETLCVDDSWITPAGVKALKKAFPRVKISAKDQQALLDPGEYGTDRYVHVSE
ncbi:MAG TPA: TIGR02996 domain-containing protein [Kofleriaceae bacterium]|nr:TIGR02996 domain-containing protein [Kofleriaceae bacterium]